ncbi:MULTISPECIES: ATP-binding protein [Bacillota]|jgi:ferredoxin|uniref:4Fe-4S binding protein n=2 Tax=Amedibacillus TaxID=2749846 RepID=A0A7G9GSL7_9FIRM|nr:MULTISPECIES: 4Fe-4S binding protein [Bacillota]QNM13799.1 4Fe-4S binding protein [[Eubacterium] hominis]MCH4283826.1 4Fe-4S binding protein [Amedibacillus hominis]RGB56713.1 ferredoxin [Absiella sp. AM22-9]RGB60846.1 ferredoxin [Absiella sp. AM10-20]RGB69128.1 ferredoxin [Absiella sp. AM09-45]
MERKIIKIDQEKCNGCGLCVGACHEGAIALVNGKATLMHEHYCDGLGDCLPSCPVNAISFEVREAPAYDHAAVMAAQKAKTGSGCPGSQMKTMQPGIGVVANVESQLRQWPVQIKLVPVNAPFFHQADILIAADCTAYAYGNFHQKFMKNKVTLIGCTKLDQVQYADKFTEIFTYNDIRSITVVRMEVPCCGGMEYAVETAIKNSGKQIPLEVVVISNDGRIL